MLQYLALFLCLVCSSAFVSPPAVVPATQQSPNRLKAFADEQQASPVCWSEVGACPQHVVQNYRPSSQADGAEGVIEAVGKGALLSVARGGNQHVELLRSGPTGSGNRLVVLVQGAAQCGDCTLLEQAFLERGFEVGRVSLAKTGGVMNAAVEEKMTELAEKRRLFLCGSDATGQRAVMQFLAGGHGSAVSGAAITSQRSWCEASVVGVKVPVMVADLGKTGQNNAVSTGGLRMVGDSPVGVLSAAERTDVAAELARFIDFCDVCLVASWRRINHSL
ncbi:unnamed protein product [Chrysoparadoxa australica]